MPYKTIQLLHRPKQQKGQYAVLAFCKYRADNDTAKSVSEFDMQQLMAKWAYANRGTDYKLDTIAA